MRFGLFPEASLRAGERREVVVGGRSIVVLRGQDGRLHAVRNTCPHQRAPLGTGRVERMVEGAGVCDYRVGAREVIRCPWHGYEFDLETGASLADPVRMRVRTYPVAVEDGIVTLDA